CHPGVWRAAQPGISHHEQHRGREGADSVRVEPRSEAAGLERRQPFGLQVDWGRRIERVLERTHEGGSAMGIDQRRTEAEGRKDQGPPTLLPLPNAREQHDRQGEEAQDEAGMEVGPDEEHDWEPRTRLRAPEGRIEDERPAEERIQLWAHVEEWRCHCETE